MVRTLSLLCIICSTQALYSQEKKELGSLGQVSSKSTQSTSEKVSNNKLGSSVTYSINRNGEQVEHNKEYFKEQLSYIENHIAAIDKKVEIIKQDERQHNAALNSGWYEKMEQTKTRLQKEREDLKVYLNSF